MASQQTIVLTQAMERASAGLESALLDELARLAQEAVHFMKQRAPKWRSALTNSIHANKVTDAEWTIGPSVDYSRAVEEGRKPGKGLPRWADPAASDIKAWLTSRAFAGRRRARRSSMAAVQENLELRDRYEGLSWHVRIFGIKPHPYVRPTAEMMRGSFPARMVLAARRYLAQNGGAA